MRTAAPKVNTSPPATPACAGARDIAIEWREISTLIPYARNARTHSDAQIAEIAGSIREFGFTNPVLIDPDGGIIAGHGRVLAARQLRMEQIPTICLSGLSETQRQNKVSISSVSVILRPLMQVGCPGKADTISYLTVISTKSMCLLTPPQDNSAVESFRRVTGCKPSIRATMGGARRSSSSITRSAVLSKCLRGLSAHRPRPVVSRYRLRVSCGRVPADQQKFQRVVTSLNTRKGSTIPGFLGLKAQDPSW